MPKGSILLKRGRGCKVLPCLKGGGGCNRSTPYIFSKLRDLMVYCIADEPGSGLYGGTCLHLFVKGLH